MNDWIGWHAQLKHRWRLRRAERFRHDFRRQGCGPTSFATVELEFHPSDEFTFSSTSRWPPTVAEAWAKAWETAICAGVYDALQPWGGSPYDALGVAATCVAVESDDVGSSEVAFYIAAWHATRKLRDEGQWDLVPRG